MFFVIVIGDIVIIVVLTGCFFVIRSRGRYRYYVNYSIYSKFESLQLKNCNLFNFDVMIKFFEDKMV